MIPGDSQPSRVFARLFLDGTPYEIESQTEKLRQGRSILDTVHGRRPAASSRVALLTAPSWPNTSARFAKWNSAWPNPKSGAEEPNPRSRLRLPGSTTRPM